jgi:outer membrane protein TolC
VTVRLLDLGTSLEGARVAESGLEAARENRRVCRDRYREGLIPSSELLDAEVALLRAGLDRTLSIAGSRVAAARLARAAGR